jgi:hypothetical protein
VPLPLALPSSEDDGGERRRAGLRRLFARKNITAADLARLIQLPNANSLYNHLAGRSAALSLETIERIAAIFPDVSFADLVGLAPRKPADSARRAQELPGVLVTIEVAAGVWRPHHELPAERWIPLPLPREFAGHPDTLFAARVKEPGAEEMYPTDTILLCRRPSMTSESIAPGTRCIVRRVRQTKVEVTVRELRYSHGVPWLWLRSTDPHDQMPLQLSINEDGGIAEPEGRHTVEILGVVVASWQPEPASRRT